MNRRTWVVLLGLALLGGAVPAAAQPATPEQQVVERFLDAYNRHDVEAMLALAHPEIQWLSVAGEEDSIETSGASALREALVGYFASLPSARSTIEGILPSGRFVSVWERAHWQAKSGGARTQSSLAVYEVEGGKIHRIWYYPVQP